MQLEDDQSALLIIFCLSTFPEVKAWVKFCFLFHFFFLNLYNAALKKKKINNKSDHSPYLKSYLRGLEDHFLYGQGMDQLSDFSPNRILV